MIDVYPYFAYANDPAHIPLDYALFKSTSPVVVDGNLNYYNLFDAMVDAFNAALEKINMSDIYLSISESGWPSAGNGDDTSIENAKTYNTNLVNHVLETGSPRKPHHRYNTFVFSMFNEDLKQPAGVEQHFGLFYPNMEPVYTIWHDEML
ncbi:Glycoside hydrolase [Macleaya cordata]|uniref:Glycoside hydrolase n=1 Tax=Macleaya cordata TaxID=56857 RepID=A0A200QEA0_MACCD|nr:Glycoside hydrolase [Macleaya cordata]